MSAQPNEAPDWAAIAAQITADLRPDTLLEGSADLPADLKKLHTRKLLLDRRKEVIEYELEQIKQTFEQRLRADEVKSYTVLGKNKVTVSEFPKDYAKPAAIRSKYPFVAADPECMSTKWQTSVTIRA